MTVYTAIFGKYEELKEPTVITPGVRYVCFTDQPFTSNVWEIIQCDSFLGNQRTARFYKIMYHRHIDDELSLWVDGSFRIQVNIYDWWNKYFKPPFTAPSHPIRSCVYEEGRICIKNKRGDEKEISNHIERYARMGVPKGLSLISSGILMRRNTPDVQKLCEYWFDEVQHNSTRDQISFSKVAHELGFNYHSFYWDYRRAEDFKFKTHYHRR